MVGGCDGGGRRRGGGQLQSSTDHYTVFDLNHAERKTPREGMPLHCEARVNLFAETITSVSRVSEGAKQRRCATVNKSP